MTDRGTILLVEDEALIAFEAEDILSELGFSEIVVCNSFAQAERTIEERDLPLAVFDLNLNGRMSTPLIERFLAKGGRVVLATGYETDIVGVKHLPIVHLPKPYTDQNMATAIESAQRTEGGHELGASDTGDVPRRASH